jgi:hypothetical protein
MQRSTTPMEWLDGICIELTDHDVMVDLDPALLEWEPGPLGAAR